MHDDKPIWSGQRLMERWKMAPTELGSLIYQGLPAYRMSEGSFIQINPVEIENFGMPSMTDLVFKPRDVVRFEQEWELESADQPRTALSAKEAQELGRLRKEKRKWDASIVAALKVGLFCAKTDKPILRRTVTDIAFGVDNRIPDTTIDNIWKAIPEEMKKAAGRPKKSEA